MTYSSTLQEIVHWLVNVPARPRFKAILKLVFQGTVYFIWRERNSRLLLAKKKKNSHLHFGVNTPNRPPKLSKRFSFKSGQSCWVLIGKNPPLLRFQLVLRNPLSPPGLIDFKLERSSLFCAVNFLLHTNFILFIVYLRFFN